MITICAWCRRRRLPGGKWVHDWKDGDYPVGSVTHGICERCGAELEEDETKQVRTQGGKDVWKPIRTN